MRISKEDLYQLRVVEQKKLKEIAHILKCTQSYVCKLQKQYGIKKNERIRVGETFGRLKVLDICCGYDEHSHAICLCQCECGNTVRVLRYSLLTDNTRSCGCLRPNQSPEHIFIPKFVWKTLRRNAQDRNLELSVTIDYLGKIFTKQEGKCALSGVDLWFGEDWNETTASIDRINSNLGYIEGNVQFVHKLVNTMKWDMTQEEFINWCQLIVENTGNN